MSDFIDELALRVDKATQARTPLCIQGGNSKAFYGGPCNGDPVDMRAWSGIVEYEPTELVITVKSGTPLATVEAALAEQQQELAFEPPRLSAQSTIGGTIVAGLAGPGRLARGGVKDYVLGCTLIDGRGQILHFGGVVMKNVAGYDVSRVIPGSMGTLGIVVDLSIKVMPMSVADSTLQFECTAQQAIERTNTWLGQPLPIHATFWHQGQLHVRLRGAQAAVSAAEKTLGGAVLLPTLAQPFWASVRDQTHPFFTAPGPLWRIAVPPTTVDLPLHGQQVHEWASGLRWFRPDTPCAADALRGVAERCGGHATLYRAEHDTDRQQAFHTPQRALLDIQRRLKHQFDPAGIFNPGRLAPIL
ncbi:MAG: glycolate oxidase subunit GlcE [Limnobacter sp.]|uniref:glycolate oxidase subunit GlcE n=1 Tax=Limnobacter sp. TaxID=2003368 RepID=UPI00391BBC15